MPLPYLTKLLIDSAVGKFPDCRAWGATYEAALANLRDVISIFVEDGLGDDEPPPQHDELSFTTLSL